MNDVERGSRRSPGTLLRPSVGWPVVAPVAVAATAVWLYQVRAWAGVAGFRTVPTLLSAVVFFVYLGVSVLLARARTADPATRVFLALGPILGLGYATTGPLLAGVPVGAGPPGGVLLREIGVAVSPGLIVAFLTVFPSRLRLPRPVVPAVLLALSAFPLGWLVRDAIAKGIPALVLPGPRRTFLVASLMAVNGIAVARLLHAALTARDERMRARARIVFVPNVLWVTAVVLFNNLPHALGRAVPGLLAAVAVSSVVLPVTFALATSRTRLFDIDRVIRRGAGYVAVTAVLGAVFLLSAPALAATVARMFPGSSSTREAASAGLAVLLVLVLNPLRARLQALIDRTFYREAGAGARLLLAALGPDAARSDAPNGPAEMEALVERVLHPEKQWLWLGPGTEPSGARDGTMASAEAAAPERVVRLLRRERASSASLRLDGLPPETPGVAELAAEGWELVLPLRAGDGALLGFWALGRKRSEEPYDGREAEALAALARSLSLQVERDRLAAQVEVERLGRRRAVTRLAMAEGAAMAECPSCGACFDGEGACPRDGTPTVTMRGTPRLLAERYRLESRLGEGGMGVVYRARDLALRRDVAVKLIHEEQALQEVARRRFRQEALLAAQLRHPNAVAVHDTGEISGAAFHVLELVEGDSLRAALERRGRLPFSEAWPLVEGMLSALAAAHAMGLVHRDVKPANLLLPRGGDGRVAVKLADFGLARGLAALGPHGISEDLTRTGTLVGSPGYIAPELLDGEEASPASDVWAAAVTTFEMLSGRRPFGGASLVEQHRSATTDAVPDLVRLAPGVPAAFAAVLARALDPVPERRPRDARALLAALGAAVGPREPGQG